MAHHNTVFAQMLTLIPTCLSRQGHEFESLAHQYHSGRRLRKMTRWTQFIAMATAQLSGRTCLLQAGQPSACLLRQGCGQHQLYEALFVKLSARGRQAGCLNAFHFIKLPCYSHACLWDNSVPG